MIRKNLANLCSNSVTRVSREVEVPPQSKGQTIVENNRNSMKSSWHCLVLYRVQDLSNTSPFSPKSVKVCIMIVYDVSLSASGGDLTLWLWLDSYAPSFTSLAMKW